MTKQKILAHPCCQKQAVQGSSKLKMNLRIRHEAFAMSKLTFLSYLNLGQQRVSTPIANLATPLSFGVGTAIGGKEIQSIKGMFLCFAPNQASRLGRKIDPNKIICLIVLLSVKAQLAAHASTFFIIPSAHLGPMVNQPCMEMSVELQVCTA